MDPDVILQKVLAQHLNVLATVKPKVICIFGGPVYVGDWGEYHCVCICPLCVCIIFTTPRKSWHCLKSCYLDSIPLPGVKTIGNFSQALGVPGRLRKELSHSHSGIGNLTDAEFRDPQ